MAQQRSVRFMPMGLEDSLDPAPVFSPTQMETSVLHSVFSPTAKQRQASSYNTARNERATDFHLEKYKPSKISPRATGGITLPQTNHFTSSGLLGSNYASHNATRSPSPRHHAPTKRLHVNTHYVNSSPTSTITNEVFYSPQSSLDMGSPRSVVSGFTHKTSSSFRSLRDVTLLDLDNIKKCNSVSDLENVIHVLNGEGKFQALLRMAKTRLQSLLANCSGTGNEPKPDETRRQLAQPTQKQPPSPPNIMERTAPTVPSIAKMASPKPSSDLYEPPRSHFTINIDPPANSPRQQAIVNARGLLADEGTLALSETNDSSLIMSLSSSILEANFDDQNLDGPHQQSDAVPAVARKLDRRRAGSHGYVSPSPSPTTRYDKKLSDDLKKLTETVLGMETARAADRKLFLDKLMNLETRKDGSDDKMEVIGEMMERSSANTRDLLRSLEQLRAESQELQESVRSERKAWRQSYAEAQQLESRLVQKVEELTQVLSSHPSQTSKEEEDRLRRQYQAQIEAKQKEHEETLGNILVGLGRNRNELRQMTQQQQDELVSSFVKESVSSKAATKALAQEVATLEKERQVASRAKQALSAQLEKSKRAQLQLERNNSQLHHKIQKLTEELAEMRRCVNEMSTNGTTKEGWEKQEKRYQEVIRSLKSQLRKEETMVSVSLYKSAVESAKEKGKEIEGKKAELEMIKQKYSNLEVELQQKQQTQSNVEAVIRKNQEKSQRRITELKSQLQAERQNKNESVAAAKQENEKLREQISDLRFEMQESGGNFNRNSITGKSPHHPESQPVQSQALRNISPMTPKPSSLAKNNIENIPPSPGFGQKQLYRSKMAFVKEAGGRKGLRQKLQQLRSPKAQQAVTMM